jgi:hypothetical protein
MAWTPITKAVAKGLQRVGSAAAQALAKVYLEQRGSRSPPPGGVDKNAQIAELAARVEMTAFEAVIDLLNDRGFRKLLSQNRARELTQSRALASSRPFIEAMKRYPNMSTKALIRQMERDRKLVQVGGHFHVPGTTIKIKPVSLASKISRLRKKEAARRA